MNFWENLTRYPRFFISACLGLILVILAPFQKFGKTKLSSFLFIIIIISLLFSIISILYFMVNSD